MSFVVRAGPCPAPVRADTEIIYVVLDSRSDNLHDVWSVSFCTSFPAAVHNNKPYLSIYAYIHAAI